MSGSADSCTSRSIPSTRRNAAIVDLKLAPRDARGRVTFTADFILLRPADLSRGNHRLLYEVSNRGNLGALAMFNEAGWNNDPTSRADAGNGFLFEQGYSLLWSGWNWDVLPGEGRLQIDLPTATEQGEADHRTGRRRVRRGTVEPKRGVHVGQLARLSAGLAGGAGSPPQRARGAGRRARRDPPRRLALRPGRGRPAGARSHPRVPCRRVRAGPDLRGRATRRRIRASSGSASPRSATPSRSSGSSVPTRPGSRNPLAEAGAPDPEAALIFGISQSGRVIQHMLWQALHVDEAGRMTFDGALIHVAGGGKGSFNHRFAQTTRHPSHLEDQQYPVDFFPFTTTPARDPVTGATGDVLGRARAAGALPRLFYTTTSTEYWTRAASLLHTDVTGSEDMPLDPHARLYFLAGAQHGNWRFAERWPLPELRQSARSPAADAGSAARPRRLDDRGSRAARRASIPGSRTARSGRSTTTVVPSPRFPGSRVPSGNLQPPRLDLGPRFAQRRGSRTDSRRASGPPTSRACRSPMPTATIWAASACRPWLCRSARIRAGTCAAPKSARRTSSPAGPARSSRSPRPQRRNGRAAIRGSRWRRATPHARTTNAAAQRPPPRWSTSASSSPTTSPRSRTRAGAFYDRVLAHAPDDPSCAYTLGD